LKILIFFDLKFRKEFWQPTYNTSGGYQVNFACTLSTVCSPSYTIARSLNNNLGNQNAKNSLNTDKRDEQFIKPLSKPLISILKKIRVLLRGILFFGIISFAWLFHTEAVMNWCQWTPQPIRIKPPESEPECLP